MDTRSICAGQHKSNSVSLPLDLVEARMSVVINCCEAPPQTKIPGITIIVTDTGGSCRWSKVAVRGESAIRRAVPRSTREDIEAGHARCPGVR